MVRFSSTRLQNSNSRTFLIAAAFAISAAGQAINPDLVEFSTIAIWQDLKSCLQSCFGGYGIHYQFGCKTNACLCRPDTLGAAVPKINSMAFQTCSAIQDQQSATSILTAYCSEKGYTSIIEPTILAPTGSCSGFTIAATTSYITQYVTVYRGGSYSPQASFFGRKFEIAFALFVATTAIGMFVL